jgi:glycosyltransferase involved in cell wall biosynthesis
MRRKLYIINNGLKDLRGHYFETSVSIAEASRSLGLAPVLAANIACPSQIVPDGLEFHAAFTTDHWMSHPPPSQPDLAGLRADPTALASNTIEDLIDGRIRFEDYLDARFLPEAHLLPEATHRLEIAQAASAARRARIKNVAKAIIPPGVLKLRPGLKRVLRQLIPPFAWSRLRTFATLPRHPAAEGSAAPTDRLEILLTNAGARREYEYAIRFRQDLQRLLCLTGCSAVDHVFLPTAHGRELCAIVDLMSNWPSAWRPTFHLEFRHALAPARDGVSSDEYLYYAAHRACFEYARAFPVSDNCRFYTDSTELSQEYEQISGLEFGVLPIPFRARLLGSRSRGDGPLQIGYFGDVRLEKGFHWLPQLVTAMMDKYVRSRRVCFLLQASLIHPEHEPLGREALAQLKRYPEDLVRLVGIDGPLSSDEYYRLVSETDILVCPYDPAIYRNRTSGTLAEAIAAGIPTVVPQGSWLARQQSGGSGETFLDLESFIEAVRLICDDYASYHSRAKAGQYAWLAFHSPERLVRCLLGESIQWPASDAKVA